MMKMQILLCNRIKGIELKISKETIQRDLSGVGSKLVIVARYLHAYEDDPLRFQFQTP
jgi:hypothetical protein